MNLLQILHHPVLAAAQTCGSVSATNKLFLIFPNWYEYLPTAPDGTGNCSPQLTSINDIWLIGAAVIEILLRIVALMAVGFIIYGGIQYTVSQGDPQQTNNAKNTVLSAVVGLVIAVSAAVVISFIAGSL